ncbi:MAG TPA: BamA/TamA family outer membrane protein [Flavipsychrobacter sp.]|nr:BamA/TamA family outer membrane protein [Flavipsychrobacter sp.]
MSSRTPVYSIKTFLALVTLLVIACSACNTTKLVKDNQYLLRSNTVKLKSDKPITRKGELKNNLQNIILQKPNTYALGAFPYKLWLYNARHSKFEKDTTNFEIKSKTVEKPVIYDSSLMNTAGRNMKSYLYNQGYFYAIVKDSARFRNKRAYVAYDIQMGSNYLINKVIDSVDNTDNGIDAAAILKIMQDAQDQSVLQKDAEFTNNMLEDERSRITSLLRDHGYYKFSQDNITFQLDTFNRNPLKDVDNPFENAVDFIRQQRNETKPILNVLVIIKDEDDTMTFKRYSIGKVQVYPDFDDSKDIRDSTMFRKVDGNVLFKYHKYYVREKVLLKHMYLLPGRYYAQSDYDKTITKLNELGIFQYLRVVFHEQTPNSTVLDCYILLNSAKKHDATINYEVSNGSTYTIGNDVSLNFRDRNLLKGANLFTASVTGGVEEVFDQNLGNTFFQHFYTLTQYYGFNTSIDFPKFIAPIAASTFTNSNLPHTIIGGGSNLIDRLNYFTLVNTNANFTYSWRETPTKTWTLSPAFINIIRLPYESDSFKTRLDSNQFLKDSYKQNFIEGENISFTFSNQDKKGSRNYSFLRLGFEEAGAVLSVLNGLGGALNNLYNIKYAQYLKFDFDGRHYFTRPHSTLAVRFTGGVGVPYGQSDALPYIKQYFVGGAYSLRGWRIRTLGPGSYYDPTQINSPNYIDRTGDIKLEWNAEYRFDIAQFASGSVKMNGALFADAGNIWLAKKTDGFQGGEFLFSTLGQDIATSIGTGLRFDIAGFFVLRFDLAFPVKKPYVFSNDGWVVNQISPFDPHWQADNLVLNIAIGYPF